MFVCTTVLYEYMKSLRIDVFNLFVNTYVRIKIYREFYQCIIYIANEGRHVRIIISSCIFRPTWGQYRILIILYYVILKQSFVFY
jgi:hypothetical protein